MEEFIIAGGGIAGSVAAIALAQRGHSPLLLERSRGPHHKVCGEFLSWEASDRLRELGFDPSQLGGARIERVRLLRRSQRAEAVLPRAATGISRFKLDEALLTHAGRAGARIERGASIDSVRECEGGLALHVGGEDLMARTVLLATGKSNLRGCGRNLDGQHAVTELVGFKAHYRLTPRQTSALAGTVELHLFQGGYAGIQLIEEGLANLCLLMGRHKVAHAHGAWDQILDGIVKDAPVLGDRLEGGEMLFERPLAVSGIPFGFIHRPFSGEVPGILRLGDQFGVFHSFTGDGMALAVESGSFGGRSAPQVGEAADHFHRRMRRAASRPIRLSAAMHRLLRHTPAQTLFLPLARVFPQLLTAAAQLTRVRDSEG